MYCHIVAMRLGNRRLFMFRLMFSFVCPVSGVWTNNWAPFDFDDPYCILEHSRIPSRFPREPAGSPGGASKIPSVVDPHQQTSNICINIRIHVCPSEHPIFLYMYYPGKCTEHRKTHTLRTYKSIQIRFYTCLSKQTSNICINIRIHFYPTEHPIFSNMFYQGKCTEHIQTHTLGTHKQLQ